MVHMNRTSNWKVICLLQILKLWQNLKPIPLGNVKAQLLKIIVLLTVGYVVQESLQVESRMVRCQGHIHVA